MPVPPMSMPNACMGQAYSDLRPACRRAGVQVLGGAAPVTLMKANVGGDRAQIIRRLDIDLKNVEERTALCRIAAQKFLDEWPIMRRIADLTSGANPPSVGIWFSVDEQIKKSRDAVVRGDLKQALEDMETARKSLRNAQATWGRYKEQNLGGAETVLHGAEATRDSAREGLFVLAVIASGGTALAVATVGSIAIEVADAAARAKLGDKVREVVSSYSDGKNLARIEALEARIAALEHAHKPAATPKHRPKS